MMQFIWGLYLYFSSSQVPLHVVELAVYIKREMDAINGNSSTPKRGKLTDVFPELPAIEEPQQFPRFLRQY